MKNIAKTLSAISVKAAALAASLSELADSVKSSSLPAELTAAELKQVLRYEPDTGNFYWRVSAGNVKSCDVAGCVHKTTGYVKIAINRKLYQAHRLAFLYMTGAFPPEVVDHINGDRDDNRWKNLREATRSQNQMNRGKQSNNTTGFKGVSFYKRDGNYKAHIKINGVSTHLGYFTTPREANTAYVQAATQHHGKFAKF